MKSCFKPVLLCMVTALSGCGLFSNTTTSSSGDYGDSQQQFNIVLADVEPMFAELDKSGGAWAYTEDLILEAKQKSSEKQFDEALKLAKEALEQTRAAKAQLESQKAAGPYLF